MNKLFLVLLVTLCSPAWALPVDAPLPDAAQEARAHALFREIRCVVCQSESVADSPAEVAADMRRLIRTQISEGKQENEIKAYLVGRYGEVILMSPTLKANTALLWLGPALFLLVGVVLVRRVFRKAA